MLDFDKNRASLLYYNRRDMQASQMKKLVKLELRVITRNF